MRRAEALLTENVIEREGAMSLLARARSELDHGRGTTQFVVGDAGMGKTTVLEAARDAVGDSVRVLSATGHPLEVDRPFALTEMLFGDFDSKLTGGAGRSPLQSRAIVHESAIEQLRLLAARGPVALLVDDMHWSDPGSTSVFAYLVRRLSSLPVMFVGALRRWPQQMYETATALERDASASIVELGPLSERATAQVLAGQVGNELDPELLARAYALSQGNPMLLQHVARQVREMGLLPDAGDSTALRLQEQLQEQLLMRSMQGLPPVAVEVAQAASVLGVRTRIAVVESICAKSADSFALAIDCLVAARVLSTSAPGYVQFSHDLLAGALRVKISPGIRRLLHIRAFEHSHARGDVDAAAPHALAADLVGDPRAVEVLSSAGARALERGAVETAVRQLAAALQLAEAEPAQGLVSDYADALFVAGRPTESIEYYQRLLGTGLPFGRHRNLLLRRAQAQAYGGDLRGSLQSYDELLATASDPQNISVPLTLERAHVVWQLGGPMAGLRAIEDVPAQPDSDIEAAVLKAATALYRLQTGDPSGLPDIDVLAVGARDFTKAEDVAVAESFNDFIVLVASYQMTERYDEALTIIERGIEFWRDVGAPLSAVQLRMMSLGIFARQGRWDQILDDDWSELASMQPLLEPYFAMMRVLALIWVGRTGEAQALAARVDTMPGAHSQAARFVYDDIRGQLLLALHQPAQAADLYAGIEQRSREAGWFEPCSPPWALGAFEAFIATDRLENLRGIVDFLGVAVDLPCTWPGMVRTAACAALAAAAGDDAEADGLYREALATEVPAPMDKARIGLRYGSWLRRRHRNVDAREVLGFALKISDECGARLLSDQIHVELTSAGGRRRRTRSGTALTTQQRRVAELAATGATVREMADTLTLSPRTVESHLAAAYRVLGVTSKRDLHLRKAELGL